MTGISHVLARKYRPQVFSDLIGQEALVRTITNAIKQNRLAHAYMLTGIRGVGKTSSARIIAKGLNCIGVDGKGGMTPNPCGKCKHCLEIAADSHIDVIEIDAASNTGVDNIREIIEGAKYNPVSARFKIYIIDEVHMLSKAAFNALLKTLEEPPESIKFIFATTEIRKVPVTILSRCQRFDLKRIDESVLARHLEHIAEQESIHAEKDALYLIARAGDGSCRDALSLLDQAITQFNLNITASDVRQMLGIADRTQLFDLYETLMSGNVRQALTFLDSQYVSGIDPLVLTQDLLSLTHWLTRIKIIPELLQDITIPEVERSRGQRLSNALSMASLTSAWQLLLNGFNEVKQADNPLIALEMVLIRLAFLSELPSPAQVVEDIKKNGKMLLPSMNNAIAKELKNLSCSDIQKCISEPEKAAGSTFSEKQVQQGVLHETISKTSTHSQVSDDVPSVQKQEDKNALLIRSLSDMAELAQKSGNRLLAYNIKTYIRPVSVENGVLTCVFTPETPRSFGMDLSRFLKEKTGINWEIRQQNAVTNPTIKEVQAQKNDLLMTQLQQTPLIKNIVTCFPGSKIGKIKILTPETTGGFENVEDI